MPKHIHLTRITHTKPHGRQNKGQHDHEQCSARQQCRDFGVSCLQDELIGQVLINFFEVVRRSCFEVFGLCDFGDCFEGFFIDLGIKRRTFKAWDEPVGRSKTDGVNTNAQIGCFLGGPQRVGADRSATIRQLDNGPSFEGTRRLRRALVFGRLGVQTAGAVARTRPTVTL